MKELECEHLWTKTRLQEDPKCERQQCSRCGDIRHVRYIDDGCVQINGIARAVHVWEDDGGLAGE